MFSPFLLFSHFCCYYCFIAGPGSGLDDVCICVVSQLRFANLLAEFCTPIYFFLCVICMAGQKRKSVEKLWREFFSDPSQWWDHRSEKVK
jgi:hypothetical protein